MTGIAKVEGEIPLKVLNDWAKAAADEVSVRTGMQCGYDASYGFGGQQVIFTTKVGAVMTNTVAQIADLKACGGHSVVIDNLVHNALEQAAPWAVAKKLDDRKLALALGGSQQPEVKPFIDPQGRRHHRLICETGVIGAKGADAGLLITPSQGNA